MPQSLVAPSVAPTENVPGKKPKVVLTLVEYGAFGGAGVFIHQVAQFLKRNNRFEPVVICSADTRLYNMLQEAGIKVRGVRCSKIFYSQMLRIFDVFTMAQVCRILAQEKPDLLHVNAGQIENLLYKKLFKMPIFYTFHSYGCSFNLGITKNPLMRKLRIWLQPLFRDMIPGLDLMAFVSRAERERLRQEGFLPEGYQGEIMYNGLDIQGLQSRAAQADLPALRRELGIPENARCLSLICRINYDKNPLPFVDLAQQLCQMPDLGPLHFIVAGVGNQLEEMKQRAQALGLAERFHFLGFREDVPELLALSDMTVSTSLQEGFGLRILESMAVGTPSITYAAGGIGEILEGPELSRLGIPVGDFDTLVSRCAEVLRLNPEARASLETLVKTRSMDFDETTFVQQLEATYTRLLENKA